MSAHPPFWVEILDKTGAVVSRQRIQSDAVTVGRSYSNDLVIDDVFAAPTHLQIAYDSEGALWLEDLGTQNGIFDVIHQTKVKRLLVGDEASIRIGNTNLRIRSSNFVVAPALPMTEPYSPLFTIGYGKAALFMMAASIAWMTLSTWLAQVSEFKLFTYLPAVIIFPLLVIGWAGIWTLFTRLVTARGQFFRHKAIAFTFIVSLFFIDLVADFTSYTFAWKALQSWMPLFTWVMIGILCFAHIRAITLKHSRLVLGIIGALVAVAIGLHVILRAESNRMKPIQIMTKLMPPFLLIKSPITPEAFFKDTLALKPKLDEERKKEPPSGTLLNDFD